MHLPRILLLIGFFAPLPIHAQALDRKFAEQDIDKERTYEICSKQYDSAHYFSVHKETEPKSFSSALSALDPSDEFGEFRDIDMRFIKTPNGVQGVLRSAEQQSSGKWKCKRGPIETPMAINKEYKTSTPIYKYTPPGCWLHSPFRPSWDRSCTSKLVGYQTKIRMLKEEKCTKGGTCLVLYKQSAEGKMARRVIGVSVASMERIFPYSERKVYSYTSSTDGEVVYKIFLGPDDLKCRTFSGIGDEAFLRREYKMCLDIKSTQWF